MATRLAGCADARHAATHQNRISEDGSIHESQRRRQHEGLFGWSFGSGPTGQGYTIGTPNVPGGIHGSDPEAAPYLFLRVTDLDEALARVRELGGTAENMDAGGEESTERFGRFALCRDDQGSRFGLHDLPRPR